MRREFLPGYAYNDFSFIEYHLFIVSDANEWTANRVSTALKERRYCSSGKKRRDTNNFRESNRRKTIGPLLSLSLSRFRNRSFEILILLIPGIRSDCARWRRGNTGIHARTHAHARACPPARKHVGAQFQRRTRARREKHQKNAPSTKRRVQGRGASGDERRERERKEDKEQSGKGSRIIAKQRAS